MKHLLLFLLLLPFFAQSQILGMVIDSETKKPVSYATISIENKTGVVNSEEDGRFAISALENQNLIVSAVGYDTKTVKTSEANTILLKRTILELDEVVILKPKNKKEIGYETFSGITRYTESNQRAGKAFPFSEKMKLFPFLKEIKFHAENELEGAKVNLMVKRLNPDGSPGDDLIDSNLIVAVKKGNRNTVVDLQQFSIQIPENGIFVCIEALKIEENKFSRDYNFPDENGKTKKITSVSYQPSFGFLPSKENKTWFFENGKWKQRGLHTIKDPQHFSNILMKKYHQKYLDLPISLTLTN